MNFAKLVFQPATPRWVARMRCGAVALLMFGALPLGAASVADLEQDKKLAELERDIEAARVAQDYARVNADLATYKALRELTGSLGGREGSIDADETKVPKLLRYQSLAVEQQYAVVDALCTGQYASWKNGKTLIRTASPLDVQAMAAALAVEPELLRHKRYLDDAVKDLRPARPQGGGGPALNALNVAGVAAASAAVGVVVDIAKLFRTDRSVASTAVGTDLATHWFDLKCGVKVLDPLWAFLKGDLAESGDMKSLGEALKGLKASIEKAGDDADAFRKEHKVADDAAGPPALALLEVRLADARKVESAFSEAAALAGVKRALWLREEMHNAADGTGLVSFRMVSETTQFVEKHTFRSSTLSGFGTAVAEVVVRNPKSGEVLSAHYVTRSGEKLKLEYGTAFDKEISAK